MALVRKGNFTGNKVPKLTKILFPWSGIFRDMCYALIGTFLLQYAITAGVLSSNPETFKAQYLVITIAMVVALIWDGINDPIMGFILEKVHFKAGKFKPWIAIGAIGNSAVVALMFLIPLFGLHGWGYVVFMIFMYILWDLFFTINDIGYWSMLPALTNDEHERASLTTKTAIASSIGTFVMTGAMTLLPGMISFSAKWIYAMAAFLVAIGFVVSQLLIYFLCQERERDKEQEEVSANSSILDLFKVVIKNKQLLFATLGMFLYYFASYILTGIGTNYFYMVFGYGGSRGGMVATIIAVIYVLGSVFSQAFYPRLIKKMSKKKLLTVMAIVIGISYLAFLFIAFPIFKGENPLAYSDPSQGGMWFLGGTMFLYYVFSFLFFAGSGIYYLIVLVMFQDAIDYNEWKYGERKESICFAWRPLDVKLASGFNRLLQFIVFAVSGTAIFINCISNAEATFNAKTQGIETTEKQLQLAEEVLEANQIFNLSKEVIEICVKEIDEEKMTIESVRDIKNCVDTLYASSYETTYYRASIGALRTKMSGEDAISGESFSEFKELLNDIYLARFYDDEAYLTSYTLNKETQNVKILERATDIIEKLNNNFYVDGNEEESSGETAVRNLYESIRYWTTEESRLDLRRSQKAEMGYIIIGTILVSFALSYCCLMFGYKIDEKLEQQIVKELEEKRKLKEANAKYK